MAAAHEVSFEFVFPTIGFFTRLTIGWLEFLNGIEARTRATMYYSTRFYMQSMCHKYRVGHLCTVVKHSLPIGVNYLANK